MNIIIASIQKILYFASSSETFRLGESIRNCKQKLMEFMNHKFELCFELSRFEVAIIKKNRNRFLFSIFIIRYIIARTVLDNFI